MRAWTGRGGGVWCVGGEEEGGGRGEVELKRKKKSRQDKVSEVKTSEERTHLRT